MCRKPRPWRERGRRAALHVLPLLTLTGVQPGAFAGELLVLASTAPALRPGEVTKTGSTINVPANAAVTLVVSPGGVLRIELPCGSPAIPAPPWQDPVATAIADLQFKLEQLGPMPDREKERSRYLQWRSQAEQASQELYRLRTRGAQALPPSMRGPLTPISAAPARSPCQILIIDHRGDDILGAGRRPHAGCTDQGGS